MKNDKQIKDEERLNQIIYAAYHFDSPVNNLMAESFIKGAKWADEHPVFADGTPFGIKE